ncbi:MAG TPA: outer membrane beta-barrel protein [Allosphingosinicella sp.]|nr:outer membrane beta-barrel protein [Allosphingosinicella sp.]
MKATLLVAALAVATPTPAVFAQEAEPRHPGRDAAAEPGFRAEALAGFDTDGFEQGLLYGGRVGYDFKAAPRFLLGIEGEFSGVTTDQEFALPGLAPLGARDGPEYYVGARATFVLSSRFRLHGGGGYSRTKEGFFYQSDPNPPPFGTVAAGRSKVEGFRLSAGAQVLLGRRAFIGAEYRYTNYGGNFFALDREQVVGSIGFRF